MNKEEMQFTKARLTLMLWYSAVLLVILAAFSVTLYATQNHNVARIVLQRNYGTNVPKTLTKVELRDIRLQVRELRHSFFLNLLFIDVVTLVLGAILSYFLAGKTLEPIRKNLQNQKEFLADASHELRSPIAAIHAACEVVIRSPHKTREDYKKVVVQTLDENIRLGKLVNDLLLLSRLDTEELASPLRSCSLSAIARHTLSMFEPTIVQKGLKTQIDIEDNVVIDGDSDKLKQLVIILLDNAAKFTLVGGTISVIVAANPKPMLQVTDTGIGIPSHKKAHIFKRFYQGDSARTSQGSGLGLAIAQSIMKQHNGTINVISNEGEGSAFVCEFPRVKRS